MKKPTKLLVSQALTEEQKELIAEMIELLSAANKMPIIVALLENLCERRRLSFALREYAQYDEIPF